MGGLMAWIKGMEGMGIPACAGMTVGGAGMTVGVWIGGCWVGGCQYRRRLARWHRLVLAIRGQPAAAALRATARRMARSS